MPVPLLDLRAQHATIRDAVLAAMMPVVDDQAFILGQPVAQLEADVAALSSTKYAVGCANGTDALLIAMRALDIGRDDEVITTPFTFFATAGTIHNVGAEAGVRGHRSQDLQHQARPRRRGGYVAHQGRDSRGPVRPDRADRGDPARSCRASPLIEDAAQSIGARRSIDGEWRMAGEVATIGTFSFFPSKNLGGYGDGGMMVTQDEALYHRLMRLRTHGSVKTYFHEEVGYNSRLDALQAAVLRAKLPFLAQWSARAPRERRVLQRRVRRTSPRSARRTSTRPTSRSSTSTRSACRAATSSASTSAPRGSGTRSTIRCRCTCSRASRTSATRRAHARSPSRPPTRSSRCRSFRS